MQGTPIDVQDIVLTIGFVGAMSSAFKVFRLGDEASTPTTITPAHKLGSWQCAPLKVASLRSWRG